MDDEPPHPSLSELRRVLDRPRRAKILRLSLLTVLLAIGYSANTVSLLALVLAIGIVVDDVIAAQVPKRIYATSVTKNVAFGDSLSIHVEPAYRRRRE